MNRNKFGVAANLSNIRAIVLHSTIALLLFSTLFVSHSGFVEAQIVPKWYGFIAGTGLLTLGCSALFIRQKIKISLNYPDIFVSIFLGYLLVRMCFVGAPAINILALTSFILLYFLFRAISKDEIRYFGIIIVCLCAVQAMYGIGQWAGIFPATAGFKMTGSFNNPAGLAACLAAGFPFCFSLTDKSKALKAIGYICAGLIAAAIILSGSRAGILAITIVSVIHAMNKYKQIIKNHFKWVILLASLLVLCAIGLFFLKKDSAAGRVAIWRNSLEMIADKPIFGHDPGDFSSEYMLYQADYLAANPDSRYTQLADNVTHPFNEYLLLAIEYGIVGILFLLLVIVLILRYERKLSIPILCLLSVAVFSCFSYPLRYPFIWVLAAYSLSSLSKQMEIEKNKTPHPFFIRSLLLLASAVITVFLIRDIRFEYEWGGLTRRGGFGDKDELIESYDRLHKRWNGDPLFLYNYGAILNQAGRYAESNAIMRVCETHLNDYDVQMVLGDNNSQLGQWAAAERSYLLAHDMIPNRFIPLSHLLELYQIIGNRQRALDVARQIVSKEIKVPSSTVYNIIRKAEEVIAETNNE